MAWLRYRDLSTSCRPPIAILTGHTYSGRSCMSFPKPRILLHAIDSDHPIFSFLGPPDCLEAHIKHIQQRIAFDMNSVKDLRSWSAPSTDQSAKA